MVMPPQKLPIPEPPQPPGRRKSPRLTTSQSRFISVNDGRTSRNPPCTGALRTWEGTGSGSEDCTGQEVMLGQWRFRGGTNEWREQWEVYQDKGVHVEVNDTVKVSQAPGMQLEELQVAATAIGPDLLAARVRKTRAEEEGGE